MVKDYVLFAIIVAVFFVGFGVGSAVFYNQTNIPILGHGMTSSAYSPQVMNQIISNPESQQQMIDDMMQNTQFMTILRENQEFMKGLNP